MLEGAFNHEKALEGCDCKFSWTFVRSSSQDGIKSPPISQYTRISNNNFETCHCRCCQCWLSIGGHSHGDSVWGGNRRRSWKSSRSAVWWSNGSEIAIFYSFVVGRNKANVWDQSEFILVFVLSVANTAEPDWAMLVNVSYPDLIYCRGDNLWDLFSISCHSWQFLVQVG